MLRTPVVTLAFTESSSFPPTGGRGKVKSLLGISVVTISLTYTATVLAQSALVFTSTDLGTLGGSSSVANAINSRGHVVGVSNLATGAHRRFSGHPKPG
jgi:uncharacterized membrane protein